MAKIWKVFDGLGFFFIIRPPLRKERANIAESLGRMGKRIPCVLSIKAHVSKLKWQSSFVLQFVCGRWDYKQRLDVDSFHLTRGVVLIFKAVTVA